MQKIIKEKFKIEKNIQIDRCHRAGKQNNRPRTIFSGNNEIQGQAIDFKKTKISLKIVVYWQKL